MDLREFEMNERDYIPKRKLSVPAKLRTVLMVTLLSLAVTLAVTSLVFSTKTNNTETNTSGIDSQMLKTFENETSDLEKKTKQLEISIEYLRNNSIFEITKYEKILKNNSDTLELLKNKTENNSDILELLKHKTENNSDILESMKNKLHLLDTLTNELRNNVTLLQNTTNKECKKPRTPDNLATVKLGTSWYYFSSAKMSWNNAKDFCISQGFYLVSIDSQEEDELIVRNRKPAEGDAWTGGYTKQDSLVWVQTGRKVDYRRNSIVVEQNKCLDLRGDSKWGMYGCGSPQRFICEYQGADC